LTSGFPSSVTCSAGFYLSTTNSQAFVGSVGSLATCVACATGASACTSALPYSATTCFANNYVLYQGNCLPCTTGSSVCAAPLAVSCQPGYYLSAGQCFACSSTTTFDSCYNAVSTSALGCVSTYYLAISSTVNGLTLATCTSCASNTL
jgi:hypothetical protein